MSSTELKVFKGNQIPCQTFHRLQKIWHEIFDVHNPLWKRDGELLSKDTFFVLYDKGKIVSGGRLRETAVKFNNKRYVIWGIADIASVVQRKGFGTIIMKSMHNHLSVNNHIGVGFCGPGASSFYKKCGFEVTERLKERFVYKEEGRKALKNKSNVLYLDKKNEFMSQLFRYPDKKAFLELHHW